ncbi:hypothetical protein GMLC_28130 [Geomonas limicola]|uniref:Uncharacterized protein n=1 Tax=Geomonas limicola TaxID=2740186 RepID=A0A6V8NBK9_9BACT|nr:hypothetical protein [Geomonas limicola]GFO69234.1 hypothetical protein GMLC_28130 [Geomonas limicola]
MDAYKFDTTGTDAKILANSNVFLTTLFTLGIFKNSWRDELGSQSALQNAYDGYRRSFEGGITGNRIDIASRKEARKALNVMIQKILSYLAIFADQSDIQLLLNTGVVTKKSKTRARRTLKPAPAT